MICIDENWPAFPYSELLRFSNLCRVICEVIFCFAMCLWINARVMHCCFCTARRGEGLVRLFVITAHTMKSHRLVASLKCSGARVCKPFVEECRAAALDAFQSVSGHNAPRAADKL